MSSIARIELETVERGLCRSLDLALAHEPDGDRPPDERWWDAVLKEVATECGGRPPLGATEIPAGRVEIKTCQRWIQDYSSGKNRRRGRWTVHWNNHQCRLDEETPTLLAVLDDDGAPDDAVAVLAAVLVTAAEIDALLEDRWTTGDGSGRGESAQVRWPAVVATDAVDEPPVATFDVERGDDS